LTPFVYFSPSEIKRLFSEIAEPLYFSDPATAKIHSIVAGRKFIQETPQVQQPS
jgi:hypothetical protein